VRARLSVTRKHQDGMLHIIYTLHAHEALLRVTASWDGPADTDLFFDHPTHFRDDDLLLAGELSPWTQPQRRDLHAVPMDEQHGCRWAVLRESGGRGLGVVSGRPMSISARNGHLRVHIRASVSYALCCGQGGHEQGFGRLAASMALPGRPFTGGNDVAALCRWSDLDGVVPLWVARPHQWLGEIMLSEQYGRQQRVYFYPDQANERKVQEVWRVDATGTTLTQVQSTAEGDGYQIDLHGGEFVLLRWR
jgi:hypothetical protein